jgi:hypothetical protein
MAILIPPLFIQFQRAILNKAPDYSRRNCGQ